MQITLNIDESTTPRDYYNRQINALKAFTDVMAGATPEEAPADWQAERAGFVLQVDALQQRIAELESQPLCRQVEDLERQVQEAARAHAAMSAHMASTVASLLPRSAPEALLVRVASALDYARQLAAGASLTHDPKERRHCHSMLYAVIFGYGDRTVAWAADMGLSANVLKVIRDHQLALAEAYLNYGTDEARAKFPLSAVLPVTQEEAVAVRELFERSAAEVGTWQHLPIHEWPSFPTAIARCVGHIRKRMGYDESPTVREAIVPMAIPDSLPELTPAKGLVRVTINGRSVLVPQGAALNREGVLNLAFGEAQPGGRVNVRTNEQGHRLAIGAGDSVEPVPGMIFEALVPPRA